MAIAAAVGPFWPPMSVVGFLVLMLSSGALVCRSGRLALTDYLDRFGPPTTARGRARLRSTRPWNTPEPATFRGVEVTEDPPVEVHLVERGIDGTETDRQVATVLGRSAASNEARRQLAAHPEVQRADLVARGADGESVVLFHIDQRR